MTDRLPYKKDWLDASIWTWTPASAVSTLARNWKKFRSSCHLPWNWLVTLCRTKERDIYGGIGEGVPFPLFFPPNGSAGQDIGGSVKENDYG